MEILEIVDESNELVFDFFEENKKQLEFYVKMFDDIGDDQYIEYELIKIIRKNIKNDYIPNLSTWVVSYKCIRKNKHCKSLVNSIRYLSKINSEDFLYCLSLLLKEIKKSFVLNQ
jgi:hypothetical protein